MFSNDNIVIGGDWNVVQDYKKDTFNINGDHNRSSRDFIKNYLISFLYLDLIHFWLHV